MNHEYSGIPMIGLELERTWIPDDSMELTFHGALECLPLYFFYLRKKYFALLEHLCVLFFIYKATTPHWHNGPRNLAVPVTEVKSK